MPECRFAAAGRKIKKIPGALKTAAVLRISEGIMKKIISVLLCVLLLASVVPLGAAPAGAASGRIYEDTEVSITCRSAGDWRVYTFVPEDDGIYIFSSSGSLDTLGYIALAEGEAESENIKADGGEGNNFAVTYDMKAGTTYYLGSTVLDKTGTYTVKVVRLEVDDGTIHPITLSQSTAVSTKKSYKTKFFSITPSTSGKYIYLSSGNFDTQGYIFDEYWRQISYSDGGGSAQNFQIELDLQAGKTYYIGYTTTSVSTAHFNVLLYMACYIKTISLVSAPAKDTYIKNIDAKYVAGITYHVDLAMVGFEFSVNYSNDTQENRKYTYGIRGLECNPSRDLLEGENDVSFSYMNNTASFKIYVTDSPVKSLSLVQRPEKTIYYDEDIEQALDGTEVFNISIYGMIFRVLYNNGTTEDIAVNTAYGEDMEYFLFTHMIKASDMHLGDNTFTLSYYGAELSFTVKYSLNSDNWQYEVNGGAVTLTKYLGSETQALIPDTLGGYPVTTIGEDCFSGNKTLKSVRMTERVTTIGDNAFYGCSALKELTLPASLTSVGVHAFYGLSALEKLTWNAVNLPISRANDTFAYMGNGTENGTEVEFGFTCEAIPENAFYNSSNTYAPNIRKITVGENVTAIGSNAFRELSNLREVEWNAVQINTTLAASNNIWLNSGGNGTFEVTFGEDVASLPNYLFYAANATRAPRVSKVVVQNKDTEISDNTFKANSGIPLTFYCRYNEDSSIHSVYRHCVANGLDYVLLDSPLSRIYLRAQLNKDEYIVGEELDLSGLSVYAVFEDNTEKEVTDKITVTGYDKDVIGTQTLHIAYTFIDKTASLDYEVIVSEEPLVLDYVTITSPAQVTSFYEGDVFDSTGLRLGAVFTNGLTQDVTDYMIIDGYDMSHAGTQTVTVSYTYEGVTRHASYSIQVQALVLTALSLEALPEKTDYLVGDTFSADGIKLIASYNSGKTADVSTLASFSGYDLSAKGEQTVTALYAENSVGKSCTFSIFVHNDLLRIEIETLPSVVSFTKGSGFSAAGIAVKAYFENGTVSDVSSAVTFSGYDMESIGTQEVTVSYSDGESEKTARYTITVNSKTLLRLQLSAAPTAAQYLGEALDITGLNISAIYSDGSRENVAAACTFSGYDMNVLGAQTVTAEYTYGEVSKSVSFGIEVLAREATGIQVKALPTKTSYLVGQALETAGLRAQLVFDNGSTKDIATEDLLISGFNSAVPGTQTVHLAYTYKGSAFEAQFAVEVVNFETAVSALAPAKTAYYYGEAFDPAGMAMKIYMADGTERQITSGFDFSGYSSDTLGAQTVTLTYHSNVLDKDFSDSIQVTVENFETAMQLTAPDKTKYYYGESFDETGMSAMLTFADGSKQLADLAQLYTEGFDASALGTQECTVSYTTRKGEVLSAGFSVTVENFETAMRVSAPLKTQYLYGEAFESEGFSATITMADGSEQTLAAADVTIKGYRPQQLGTQVLTVEYTTVKGTVLRDTFAVQVLNFETALSITAPSKVNYYFGDALNTAGMRAQLLFADGSKQSVELSRLSLTGYSAEVLGAQTVRASYAASTGAVLSDTFEVTVANFETAIALTPPAKTAYFYGESFESAGLQVEALMADGSTEPADTENLSIFGFDTYTLGVQTVTVAYTSAKGEILENSFPVEVRNYETALQVSAPQKTAYDYGEALDTAGMSAVLTFADGTHASVMSEQLSLTGYRSDTLGEQTVTASYTAANGAVLTDSFTVTVANYETAMKINPPARVKYYYGESLNTAGLSAEITMADGSKKTLGAAELTLSAFDGTLLGEQVITATYQTSRGTVLSDSFTVEVVNFDTGLSVLPPTKTAYFYGDSFNAAGMSAKLISASGETTDIDASRLVLSGYQSHKLGVQTITASYTTATGEVLKDTFTVTVNNFEKSIAVNPPEQTEYYYGDSLNKAGLSATATMADGSSAQIDGSELVVYGYNANKLGEQSVGVMYRNAKNVALSGRFTVTVQNFETALKIETAPDKTVYYYGESLDLTGLSASLIMADGSTVAAPADALRVASYHAQRVGTQTVAMQYTGVKGNVLADSFAVSILNYPQRLELSGDYPLEFTQGDSFSAGELKALVYFADGTRKNVTALVAITGYDMESVGEQTVTVSYAEGEKTVSASYVITVKQYESEAQRADVTGDGFIDIADVSVIIAAANYGADVQQAANARADVNRDGAVNIADVAVVLSENNYAHRVEA